MMDTVYVLMSDEWNGHNYTTVPEAVYTDLLDAEYAKDAYQGSISRADKEYYVRTVELVE